MSQTRLAEETGLSRSLIAKVERGIVNPSYENAKKIFDKLEEKENAARSGLQDKALREICSTQIEYADAGEPIIGVQLRMACKALSQLPVRDQNCQIVGSITERGINRAYIAGDPERTRTAKVSSIMEEPFPILPADTPLVTVIGLLQRYQAVLVQEHGSIMGIASNTDLAKVFNIKQYD
ncbi:helix-turn-helix domain-containing protein [Candidatus Bathyarchaeota archaeon]|nr:helix-turn-helix domain-containing protein [Candidatus Bathyarchaeota archaeon]